MIDCAKLNFGKSMSEDIKIENALCFNLYSASRAMTQAYRPYLKGLGLTYPQFLVMFILWENPKTSTTVKSLGERLYLDSGTLSPMLKRLESQDLITRERSKSDERETNIILTKNGRKLKTKTKDIPMEMFCKLQMNMERFGEILEGVKEVLGNLNDSSKDKLL